MPVQHATPNADAILERFDSVTSQAMIHLHRREAEREEWDAERDTWRKRYEGLQRALESQNATRAGLLVIPLRATLRQAIGRIDRILNEAGGGER